MKPGPKIRPRPASLFFRLLPGAGVAVFSFALYLATLAPTVLPYDDPTMYDPAMLQAEARVLGIGHPSGYPTYMMLTHLFTYLPFGDVAYRVNLASAVYAASAVFVVYLVGLRLTPRIVAAATGALAFGTSWTFWSQATLAEVYTLNVLFVALILLTLLVWRDRRQDRFLLLAAFLMGLSLTHHLTSGLLLPAGLLFVFVVERGRLRDRTLMLKCGALFALGLLPYLYLPARALMEAPLNEADPSGPGRFLLLVTASSYLLKLLTDVEPPEGASPEVPWQEELSARLATSAEYLSGQFSVPVVLVGVLGFYVLARRDRAFAMFSGLLAVGWSIHALTNGVKDFYVFLIPAYLVFAVWISAGAAAVLGWTEDVFGVDRAVPARALPVGVSAVLIGASLLAAWGTYGGVDRSGDFRGRESVEAVARYAAPGATILHHRSPLWYMVLVEGRRRDLTLVDPFKTSWYRFEDVTWPEPLSREEADARYRLDDTTGVEAAKAAARNGRVYVLAPGSLDGDEAGLRFFEKAGFEAVRVGGAGGLYELVPRGRDSSGTSGVTLASSTGGG